MYQQRPVFKQKLLTVSVAASLSFATSMAAAAPGKIAQLPLFLGEPVQPNILLLVDDSGSMDWEVLKTQGALDAHGTGSNSGNLSFAPDNNTDRRELCAGYNAMAYDPEKIYTPWVGKDNWGADFTDRTLTTAKFDPFSSSSNQDIRSHYYYVWNDANGDGEYQFGECPITTSDQVHVDTLSATEQVNYANWYSYYRKREYVAKRALSQIIDESSARVGLATLHNNNAVGTIIKDVDDITVPINATAVADKLALKKNLFRINSANGTPLRQTLKEAGEYFRVGVSPGSGLFGFTPSPTSPILPADQGGECQQNFSILMTDGYWNGSSPSVGNADGNGDSAWDGSHYGDSESNTLADVAMHYYEIDLAPAYANNVRPMLGIDENTAQHMVTFTVAFGVNGYLDPAADPQDADFGADLNGDGDFDDPGEQGWPTPEADQPSTIDDMRHAAYNGRGLYLSAKNPDNLISSLAKAIQGIADRQGSASAVSFNTTSLQADTYVFQATFNSSGWYGELYAYEFDETGVGDLKWQAGELLADRNLTTEPREIVTFNGTKGIPFRAPVSYQSPTADELQLNQTNDLLANAAYPADTSDATERADNQAYLGQIVDYLRGDQTYSDNLFRNRFGKRLGDIINSSPQFVGKPSARYPNNIESTASPYGDFVTSNQNRKPLVYIGANDGMLHAFEADTGEEYFAYLPGLMYSSVASDGLHFLAEDDYAHKPYVDATPTIADVYIGGGWKTYLVGALSGGGKGIFVLDITDPSDLKEASADQIVKMEFTDDNLGYSFSRPLVGKLNNGKWAAIFGNGYNADPNGDGKAKLFILYLDGSGHKILDTGVGSIVNNSCQDAGSDCNGMSSPSILDMTGDGLIDRVYAGDLHGNLWAFDLRDTNANNWASDYVDGASNPQPLFKACSAVPCTVANRQPITTRPSVDVHPDRRTAATWPNLMVFFGTGQYLATSDNFTTAQQSTYGVWDAGAANAGYDRSKMQQQTFTNSATVTSARDISTNHVNYLPSSPDPELGWYEDFPDTGERQVTNTLIAGDVLFYNTMVPDSSLCGSGGYGYITAVDKLTGGALPYQVFDKINGQVLSDKADMVRVGYIPAGSDFMSNMLVTADSGSNINTANVKINKERPNRRSAWSVVQ